MKTPLRPACLSLIVGLAALRAPAQDTAGTPAKAEIPTEAQLRELGHLLYRTSNINVVNGLNLSREQAVALRDMAKDVEETYAKNPAPRASYDNAPELKEVRDGLAGLAETLSRDEPVTAELRAKILKLRTVESKSIRAGLVLPPRRGVVYGQCARCHVSPDEDSAPADDDSDKSGLKSMSAGAQAEAGYAHMWGAFDRAMTQKLTSLGPRVDDLLTETQKEVFTSFSCCLIPPKGMSDPVRVGQAGSADWEVEMLKKVRKTSESSWPASKKRLIGLLTQAELVKNPGLTDEDKQKLSDRVGGVMDKAREMSDADFELSKDELCAELHGKKAQEQRTEVKRFQQAFFLLQPGSSKAYDDLIQRIDNPAKVERPATAPDGVKPGT